MSKVKIYREVMPVISRGSRRAAEREVVAGLVTGVFGAGVEMSHDDDGRPYLPSRPDVYISVSHCADECVLAVSDGPVGIDVETARPQLSRVAAKFLTGAEASRGPHDILTLLQYWTAKEAVFKCAGVPALVISEIEVSADMSHAVAHGCVFSLEYHFSDGRKVMAVAERL